MRLIGRNDPCFCGSGKKYKKCCIDKDVKKESGEDKRTSTSGMEYFTNQKYAERFGYPLTRYDNMVFELINFVGQEISNYKNNRIRDVEEILIKIAEKLKEFEKTIKEVRKDHKEETGENLSLSEKVDFRELGLYDEEIVMLPNNVKEETVLNFYYAGIARDCLEVLCKELEKRIGEEKTTEISFFIYERIFQYISKNCRESCNDSCLRNMDESGYCIICQLGEKKLKCPKRGEITYYDIKATEKDMDEHKN